jgi:predicted phage terminase large subunit-like protein
VLLGAEDFPHLPDELGLEAESLRASFSRFAQAAWPVIEPGTPLSWGRLQEAICEHLQAVSRGDILDLIINVRPRSSKSRLVSILWPAWEWTWNPTTRWLTGSFELALSRDLSRHSLNLIRSPWYTRRFPEVVIDRRVSAPTHFANLRGGERAITANRAGVTGKGGERLVWDDPHDAKKGGSAADLEAARTFWKAFSSRKNSKTARRVVMGQRVAHSDIFKTLEEEGGWECLRLRTRYSVSRPTPPTSIGWVDPRTREGEFLDEDRFGEKEDARARLELGPQGYAAQHDQEPTPEGGSTFRLEDFRRWRFVDEHLLRGVALPDVDAFGRKVVLLPRPGHRGEAWTRFFDDILWSWDFTFKGEDDSDWVVGQMWARKGPDFFLLHQHRERLDFTGALAATIQTAALYPAVWTKLVEDGANGPAVVSMLRAQLIGLELVGTKGKSKVERARAVSPLVRAGNVYVPEDTVSWGLYSSVPLYLEELRTFPRGDNDDQVDATSQALLRLYEGYQEWMESVAGATGALPPGATLGFPLLPGNG